MASSIPSVHRIQNAKNNPKLSALRRQLSGVNMKGNLTGFNTNTELAHWLQSEAVALLTDELAREYIEREHLAAKHDDSDEETDFIHHLEHTMTTIDDPVRLEQYTGPAPNKADWSKYDHATRFMVQIIRYDKENEGRVDGRRDWMTWRQDMLTTPLINHETSLINHPTHTSHKLIASYHSSRLGSQGQHCQVTMAPKKTENGTETETVGPSARDVKMMTLALKSLPPSVQSGINYDIIVAEFGQKDVKSARECFRQLCKKHGWFEGINSLSPEEEQLFDTDGPSTPAPSTPGPKKTPAKRSTVKTRPAADDGEADLDESPTKKLKRNPKQHASSRKEAANDNVGVA
ncbi:hypothetical protein DL766_000816 [Monosporascus sp. MC13-8B]|uniref:ASX DEUBAD domain-containing protein n=1 Tax=Monosporascus cannonballus TaxID=155416 RepID=A0ABY0HIS9_9PEZI|nr:hypothetical protein DL762_001125 [Monosporascus cannonballus]RYP38816.1 hypothetical protein DL766_000816 [Monosporascus sp. MC13-8B]